MGMGGLGPALAAVAVWRMPVVAAVAALLTVRGAAAVVAVALAGLAVALLLAGTAMMLLRRAGWRPGAAAKPVPVAGIAIRISFSMSRRNGSSSCEHSEIAMPSAPARAVRPMRCT